MHPRLRQTTAQPTHALRTYPRATSIRAEVPAPVPTRPHVPFCTAALGFERSDQPAAAVRLPLACVAGRESPNAALVAIPACWRVLAPQLAMQAQCSYQQRVHVRGGKEAAAHVEARRPWPRRWGRTVRRVVYTPISAAIATPPQAVAPSVRPVTWRFTALGLMPVKQEGGQLRRLPVWVGAAAPHTAPSAVAQRRPARLTGRGPTTPCGTGR